MTSRGSFLKDLEHLKFSFGRWKYEQKEYMQNTFLPMIIYKTYGIITTYMICI